MEELSTQILIVGGGVGGCAAALAACSRGIDVVLTEESDWIGGQFTSQATPPDEHGWIEEFGCTRTYREFREKVREFYRRNYPLTDEALSNPFFNPGNGWVSPLCAEPRVFLTVLEDLLAEFVAGGRLLILRETVPFGAHRDGDSVTKVRLRSLKTNDETTVSARYFIDATELGDLLPLTGTDFVTGSEPRHETGEPGAKATAAPHNSQAFSVCFAMSYHENADHTIERPENYAFWRDYVPALRPPWSGRLLSLTGLNPRTLAPVTYNFAPNREPNTAFAGLWTYRRILHTENFRPGAFESDVTLVNYPQIDFLGGDLLKGDRDKLIAAAKGQSLSFIYYLQTELGFRGLKLRGDVTGGPDGLAKMPYIRESRRIRAAFTITEAHISARLRPNETYAEKFNDSVGIGFYRIDLHPTVGGDNYVDIEALPFQIPLGALLPKTTANLLAVCKNIGTTHITNGCYRLHPIEWNIGESVGRLLAFCLKRNLSPREVRSDEKLLPDFQKELVTAGVEIEWPEGLNLADGDPHRHAA